MIFYFLLFYISFSISFSHIFRTSFNIIWKIHKIHHCILNRFTRTPTLLTAKILGWQKFFVDAPVLFSVVVLLKLGY